MLGGKKVENLIKNIQALEIALSPAQLEYLEGAIPFEHGFSHWFIVRDPYVLKDK